MKETLRRLLAVPEMAARREEIERAVERAADAPALLASLLRVLEAGGDPRAHLPGWLKLLDASPAAADVLVARPALLREVPADRGRYDRAGFESELDAALASLPRTEDRLDFLRRTRVEQTLRIAWQDVVEGADLTVVTRRISDLAEILLERVFRLVQGELSFSLGRPWHEGEPVGMGVIAMGKLGGAELNYSSDIDLIFVYGRDGETDGGESGSPITNREYFHRLAERLTREVGRATPAGRLYRVDLRLRPEGASGSLALSLASTLAYYRRRGETWERQALLKARAVAGDRALGNEFTESVKSWVYGSGLDLEEIASLKRVKQRMEQATLRRGEEKTEVKLGYGGIRDVEYVIQFLQLLHGAHDPSLRHHNSLAALRLLERAGAILERERDVLDEAYRFLRKVEHRLQLVQHAQIHRIPSDGAALLALSRRCGFPATDAFLEAYRVRAEGVRSIFNRLFREIFLERDPEQRRETELVLQPEPDSDALRGVLERHGISDLDGGLQAVERLVQETSPWLKGSPRTRKLFADLFPRLLDAVARTPDPDAALRRLERVTARVGARGTLYEAFRADDRLLRLLVDLTGNSRFLCNILERAPGTLDQLVDAVAVAPGRGLASFEDIPTATIPTAPDPARILADYKSLEVLRIGLRDVRGEQGVRETGEDLTRLAEVVVRLAFERSRLEVRAKQTDLVVLALGKFGARELTYGSDLDLVFFCLDPEAKSGAAAVARRLAGILETPTAHGRLYDVDFRLRPGGGGGPLLTTPKGFSDYFRRGLGDTWERMAYTRARAVAGAPSLCEEIEGSVAATIYESRFNAEDQRTIAWMREKLAHAGGPESLKRSGSGGVVDVEFAVQIYALRHGRDDPRFRSGNVPDLLRTLEEAGILEPQHAADVQIAYRFLLALESKIRIVADLPEDRLPEDPVALRALARRLGYVDVAEMRAEDALREEYTYHREVAARAFRESLSSEDAIS